MIPWSLRDVDRRRWREAQDHEAGFWTRPRDMSVRSQRAIERYAGLLRAMERDGSSREVILEVGCGPTCVTQIVTSILHVFADPLMTVYRSVCPDLIPGHFLATVGEELPFRDGTFDAVFSFNAIDHVFSPSRFVAELVRVTRPRGHVVLGVYTHPRPFVALRAAFERLMPWFREVPHPFFFSRQSLVHLLSHYRLRVERVVRVHAAERFPSLRRQDWVAVARKTASADGG